MSPESATSDDTNSERVKTEDELKLEKLQQRVCKAISADVSKDVTPQLDNMSDLINGAIYVCQELIRDSEKMNERLKNCIASTKELEAKVPKELLPLARTPAAKALLQTSREQKLPPHLVNRLNNSRVSQNGFHNAKQEESRAPTAMASWILSIEAPPLPPCLPPIEYITVNGSLMYVPLQPPLLLEAKTLSDGVEVVGQIPLNLSMQQFQPATSYHVYCFNPKDGPGWKLICELANQTLPLNFKLSELPTQSALFYAIQAVDGLGRVGQWSNVIKVIVG